MPGHFTHIYTARRVADHLLTGRFPDWPVPVPELAHFTPQACGQAMKDWEKFTAIGAIGPDLFYFSQDYNSNPIGPLSDELMLALKVYYFFDAAKEDDWEPLLIILDKVSSTMAHLLRILIKLQKLWNDFVAGWNATIGPLVSTAEDLTDALTGGVISEFKVVMAELKLALVAIGEEELLTFKDIFTMFDTCVQKGFDEQSFLWSDMSHYRRPSALCRSLVRQAELLLQGEDGENRSQQFLAFALGYITHVGTDVVAHSFVNEQCGGPFRNHPQRHHLIENHIDAYNYGLTRDGEGLPADPWGSNDTYPELSMCALWFAVQLTPDDPHGAQRPAVLPEDPDERKKALDVDGEMPLWMAEAIVRAMIEAFAEHPHPLIYGGDAFQAAIDQGKLADVIFEVTGQGMDRPFGELLDAIAPKPSFEVPRGFPLPWQIQTVYLIMISFYKFSFSGTWELQKPRKPDFIITPPASDIENLLQPPDFSGASSGNPIADVCSAIVALFEWAVKEIEAALQLAEDLIKMLASPGTYLIRLGLYELAMMVWDVAVKTHDVLAHTGFFMPHGEQRYDDGELRLPNEIDLPLITLGGTVDATFQQALGRRDRPFRKSRQGRRGDRPRTFGARPQLSVLPRSAQAPQCRRHGAGTTGSVGISPALGLSEPQRADAGR
ncbi:MAG: zinc dependent phospholipase C family protein [Croceibacterium sp.]